MDHALHHIVVHTYPGQWGKIYTPLLGDASDLTGVSLQNDWQQTHQRTLQWINASAKAGKSWVVANDEQGPAKWGAVPDTGYQGFDPAATGYSMHDIRQSVLWGNLMAGGAGVEYYFGYELPENDLKCEDYRSRDTSWDYGRIALEFFDKQQIPFWEMANDNSLLSGGQGYCLQKTGQVYCFFLKTAGDAKVSLPKGDYSVRWYDPRAGGDMQTGTVKTVTGPGDVSLGNPPENADKDWVVLIERIKPFAGNWQGSGVDSQGNEATFAVKVIDLGDHKYRMLILDALDTQNDPMHVMDGVLKKNEYTYTADGGAYTGGGKLDGDTFAGYYKGSVDGTFKMQRAK
jgi:hypothetical protein